MNLNEATLWRALKAGDTDALFTIYEMMHPDLVRYGRNISSDEELVKDTINQFFLYLWDKRYSLNEPQNLQSYLLVSFRRKLIYELKVSSRTISLANHEYDLEPEQSAEDIMIENNSAVYLTNTLSQALDKLPQRQRELLRLRYYESLSFEQISEKTSLSIRTIYNKIHEAIKSLRKDLKP